MEAGRFGDGETQIETQVATQAARLKGRNSQEGREEENRLDARRPSHGSSRQTCQNTENPPDSSSNERIALLALIDRSPERCYSLRPPGSAISFVSYGYT